MYNGLADCHRSRQCHRAAPEPPGLHVTILRHCRCQDCEHWIGHPCNECAEGIIRNGAKPVPEYPPDAWHYCAAYDGPRISKDVWAWPKAHPGGKERPAPGGGRPGGGPNTDRPGGNRSDERDGTRPGRPDARGFAPATPRAAQGGAGSTISAEVGPEAAQTPNAKGVRP